VVENTTEDTWRNVRNELDRMHLVTLSTPDGHVAQRSTLTAGQKTILAALNLPEPPKFFDFTTPATDPARPVDDARVVTRPHPARSASALLSTPISWIVCPSSAELRPEQGPLNQNQHHAQKSPKEKLTNSDGGSRLSRLLVSRCRPERRDTVVSRASGRHTVPLEVELPSCGPALRRTW